MPGCCWRILHCSFDFLEFLILGFSFGEADMSGFKVLHNFGCLCIAFLRSSGVWGMRKEFVGICRIFWYPGVPFWRPGVAIRQTGVPIWLGPISGVIIWSGPSFVGIIRSVPTPGVSCWLGATPGVTICTVPSSGVSHLPASAILVWAECVPGISDTQLGVSRPRPV